jgi:hypothetical protein
VSHARLRGPIVIDTDVFSADLVPGASLADRYAPVIAGRPALISFQTAAELRYGALRRGWGEARGPGSLISRQPDDGRMADALGGTLHWQIQPQIRLYARILHFVPAS